MGGHARPYTPHQSAEWLTASPQGEAKGAYSLREGAKGRGVTTPQSRFARQLPLHRGAKIEKPGFKDKLRKT